MSKITVNNISVEFPIYNYRSQSIRHNLFNLVSAGRIFSDAEAPIVKALDGISLSISEGDRVGLIGGNGAGKTTLLRVLSGIYHPTSGAISKSGTASCLLGTGFGMEEEATGYENIILSGITLGISKKNMESKIAEIEEFTELGPFMSMPIRSYSSGMKARLAFAISTSIKPEILLMDEGLGVGDAAFVDKAKARLGDFMGSVKILVFASHSNALIKSICNKVIYMQSGKILFEGDVEEGLRIYSNDAAH